MAKRAVASILMPDVLPGEPATAKPELTWMAPTDLLVDEAYQRDLSDKSLKLIGRIVQAWDWRRFKPPVVVMTADGFEVLDGQHSAIAAASHPNISEIPVVVVDAPERHDRASAFIGHNRDRIVVTAAQLHAAAVEAGDEDAQTISQVCERAGVLMLRMPPANAIYKARETIAIVSVQSLVGRRGAMRARQVLEVLANAELGPIQANHIKAAEHLLTNEEFADLDVEDLSRTARTLGAAGEREEKTFAATHGVPVWRGLAAIWFKAARKKRCIASEAA